MVFNDTFFSCIVAVGFIGGGNQSAQQMSKVRQTTCISHDVVSSTPCLSRIRTLVVIGPDCIGSCKSNYHTITFTTIPLFE